MTNNYKWTDNPTVAGVSVYDPDVLNDCLMHLKDEFNNVSNVDLSNLTDEGKRVITELVMPAEEYLELPVGASDTEYTAPANGYAIAEVETTATNGWISVNTDKLSTNNVGPMAKMILYAYVPLNKGDKFTIRYMSAALKWVHFHCSNGNVSEEK